MGRRTDPEPSREAEIDAALKALFDALAGQPAPIGVNALIDQLERQAGRGELAASDAAEPARDSRRAAP